MLEFEQKIEGLPEANVFSYTSVEMLSFLRGRKLDDVAWSCISGLRPSKVEIIKDGCTKMNSVTWRVRVFMDGDVIETIKQEIRVGLYGKIEDGHHLGCLLKGKL